MLPIPIFPAIPVYDLPHPLTSLILLFSFYHPSIFDILLDISSFFFLLLRNHIRDHLQLVLVLPFQNFVIFVILFYDLALYFTPILVTHLAFFSISFIFPIPYFWFSSLSIFLFRALWISIMDQFPLTNS